MVFNELATQMGWNLSSLQPGVEIAAEKACEPPNIFAIEIHKELPVFRVDAGCTWSAYESTTNERSQTRWRYPCCRLPKSQALEPTDCSQVRDLGLQMAAVHIGRELRVYTQELENAPE